jgi:hypothetical protein
MKLGAWTEEERAFIQTQWERMEDAELAVALNRPMGGVAMARLKLGLRRPRANGEGRFVDRDSLPPR